MLATSTSGNITFLYILYRGKVSDRYITGHSGFLEFVEEGDDIMADRGFTLRYFVTNKKVTLSIPIFTRKCSLGKGKAVMLMK